MRLGQKETADNTNYTKTASPVDVRRRFCKRVEAIDYVFCRLHLTEVSYTDQLSIRY